MALGIADRKVKCIDPNFKVGDEYDEQTLVGKRVTLLLEYDTYKGRTSLRPARSKLNNFGYKADTDVPF